MRACKIRIYTKKILLTLNVILIVFFLLGSLSPYMPPNFFWWAGFIGIGMPYIVLLLLFTILFWLIVKPRMAIVSLIAMLIGIKQIKVLFAWNFNHSFNLKKETNDLRIVSWNVESLNGLNHNLENKKNTREDIVSTIKGLNADIVCLQEFNNSTQTNNVLLFKPFFPNVFFPGDYFRKQNDYQSGNIILSKFPIIESNQITFPSGESLIYIDIVKQKDTFRVYTTHLQSYKFNKKNYDDLDKIKQQDEEAVSASKSIIKKMKLAFLRRGKQANMIVDELEKNRYSSILCGDFNDVPNNHSYWHIKGDRQDAFLQKGFGIGKTFTSLAPTLRIDYILPDNSFDVRQFDLVDEGLSDHVLLVCDLKKKQ